MKYLFTSATLLLLFLGLASASITNTTDFFTKETSSRLYYQIYSGYENVFSNGSAAIYYSLWQGYNIDWRDKSAPFIIWLQGGPGASSQFGCFNEVGPIHIDGTKENLKPIENVWAWNFYGHLMCVDQPIGIGFSYNNNTEKVNNTRTAADHFVTFLTNFFNNNPSFDLKKNPLYLAGESYAGHYIPAFAEKILANRYSFGNLVI